MEHAERRAKIMARGSSNPTLPTSNKRNDDGFPFEDHPSVRSIGARINRLFGYVKRHPKAFVIAFIVLLYMFGGPFFIWFLGYRKHSGSTGGVGHGVLKASDVVKSPVNVVQQFMASAIQKGVDEVETIKKRLKTTEEQLAFERGKVAELQKKIESTAKEPLVGGDKVALVAILTSPDRFQRRATIRATAFQLLPPGIDVFFVMAAANESTTAALVAMEKKAYGDVIVLDGVGEDAKTVGLMELAADKVKSPFKAKYRFLVKGDDNAFLHFVNLKARLAGVEGDRIYFGRPTSTLNSMHDSAYALSWPIVEDLATHQITSSAQTDALIPLWLTSPDISHVKLYEKEVSEIYIDPVQHIPPASDTEASPTPLSKATLTPGTIAVLSLSNDARIIAVSSYFLRHLDASIRGAAASESGLLPGAARPMVKPPVVAEKPVGEKPIAAEKPSPLPALAGPPAVNGTNGDVKGEPAKEVPAPAAPLPVPAPKGVQGPADAPLPVVAQGPAAPPPKLKANGNVPGPAPVPAPLKVDDVA